MKTFRPQLHVLFLAVSICFYSSDTFAQNKVGLPPELNQRSSLREVLEWLDKTSFVHARVGLNDGGSQGGSYEGGGSWDGMVSEKRVFSQGFKFANLDGCTVTLRNDDVKLLHYDSKAPETMIDKTRTQHVAELYIPLYRLSDTKGKAPYRHTRNPEKARLLGTWRAEFKHRGFFSRHDVGMAIFGVGQRERKGYRDGDTLTFSFDSKEMSEKFDAVFRQAVKLCKKK